MWSDITDLAPSKMALAVELSMNGRYREVASGVSHCYNELRKRRTTITRGTTTTQGQELFSRIRTVLL